MQQGLPELQQTGDRHSEPGESHFGLAIIGAWFGIRNLLDSGTLFKPRDNDN